MFARALEARVLVEVFMVGSLLRLPYWSHRIIPYDSRGGRDNPKKRCFACEGLQGPTLAGPPAHIAKLRAKKRLAEEGRFRPSQHLLVREEHSDDEGSSEDCDSEDSRGFDANAKNFRGVVLVNSFLLVHGRYQTLVTMRRATM